MRQENAHFCFSLCCLTLNCIFDKIFISQFGTILTLKKTTERRMKIEKEIHSVFNTGSSNCGTLCCTYIRIERFGTCLQCRAVQAFGNSDGTACFHPCSHSRTHNRMSYCKHIESFRDNRHTLRCTCNTSCIGHNLCTQKCQIQRNPVAFDFTSSAFQRTDNRCGNLVS